MTEKRIKNWDGTQSWTPSEVHHPADETEVAQLVARTAEAKARCKAIGGALSWSDAIDIPGSAIRLDRLAEVVSVDTEARRVTVHGGARLSHVNDVLAQRGLAFDNFGSIVMQTAAGYTGTGSHGTGGRTPILSSYITALRLVDGRGEVHRLDDTHEPSLFSAARVHLGCLGVVTEITFQCVDAFDLEERLELLDFDTVLADLDGYVDDNDYCKLWWLPYTGKVQVYTFNKTDRPRTGFGVAGFLDSTGISVGLFEGLIRVGRVLPPLVPTIQRAIQLLHFKPRRRVHRSDKIIRYSGTIPKHQESEYAIPRSKAALALDKMRALVLSADYRVNFPMEVRFVAGDDIPMSPAYQRNSCYIGAYIANRKAAPRYHADFEALMSDYSGRPHWGKSFSRTAQELRQLYPAYHDFDRIRHECDPHGVFRNQLVDRVFPENAS